jgi:hypothetical protein
MIKLKNKLYYLLFTLLSVNGFCQEFKYDLDKNGKEDKVELNKENYSINVNINDSICSFEVPEITGYEKISLIKFDPEIVNMHYSSSNVSTIDLLIRLKNKKWTLTNTIFYSPCQTCQDGEVKTCENVVSIELKKLNEDNVDSLVFNEINCRKLYVNVKVLSVKDLSAYTNKIISKEYILDIKTINKTLELYPINQANFFLYKKIKKSLQKIKFNASKLNQEILNFEKRKSK